jgi:hypothetical protein
MKTNYLKLSSISLILLLLCSTSILADWDQGQSYKMHYPQLPDPTGWDICLLHQFLADDFMCTQTGPITDIHFWISWQHDLIGSPNFEIEIHPDMMGMPAPAPVWVWNGLGNIKIRHYDMGLQNWFCPLYQSPVYNDHTQFFQVNITDISEPMIQEHGQIYWLVIRASGVSDPFAVGWKTSLNSPPSALWGSPAMWSPDLLMWSPINTMNTMPQLHDMSFVITSTTQPNLDFGDAPDPNYPTLLASDGARHKIVPGILLGALIDSEADGLPDPAALGDDNNNLDDEDGVAFTSALIPGQAATVSVDLSNCTPGISLYLNAWVDFNGNGSWADAEDKIFSDLSLVGGSVYSLNFTVPATAVSNSTTFARFRLSSLSGLSYAGLASDGEVEDYTAYISMGEIPVAEHLKWSQPPLEIVPMSEIPEYCGWNQESWTQDFTQPLMGIGAADDFRCIGPMPVTSIHWWGSYIGWMNPKLPQPQPQAWLITFWTNVRAGPTGAPSHPGMLISQLIVPNERVQAGYVGMDYFYTTMESCFKYDLNLLSSEYFQQQQYTDLTDDNVFWLGIKAMYIPSVQVANPWGWKTRPQHWMDDAVITYCTSPAECEYTPIEYQGESYDLAFELDTLPQWIKWEQAFDGLRKWPYYMDQVSMANVDQTGELVLVRQVADDWKCEKRTPVTSIVWWGSYLGYIYQPCSGQISLTPPKPDYFLLSIWTDVPAGADGNQYTYSHPGRKLWEYAASNYDEVLVGYDMMPGNPDPGPRESVFRYSVDLPKDKWFRQRKVGQIYWISIVAVYGANNPPPLQWGWTNHKHYFNDDAVAGTIPTGSPELVWEELYDASAESADQSFVLFTDPGVCVACADYDWDSIINFLDYAVFANEWGWTGQAGGNNDADLNCDGSVDPEDLRIFCDQWLQSCPL